MTISELELKAATIRQNIIKMLVAAGSGHSAGPLDLADVFAALYFADLLKYRPQEPDWPDRDRLVLSCGHVAPVFYATLIEAGFLSENSLPSLRKLDSLLQGHPHHEQTYPGKKLLQDNTPGVENSSGPLGQGMSVAVGLALAGKMNNRSWRVYLVGSDGELDEGQSWEALMFAGNHHLSNLTYLLDRNNIQINGYTEKTAPLEPLADKLKAFNFHILEINGHLFEEIIAAVKASWEIKDKPTVIICNTIPGKGVDFMEGDYQWHGKPPDKNQGEEALKELRTLQGKIKAGE